MLTCAYCLRQDYRLDGEVLLPYDLKASGAHATMLQKIGVLTTEEELDGMIPGHSECWWLYEISKLMMHTKKIWKEFN